MSWTSSPEQVPMPEPLPPPAPTPWRPRGPAVVRTLAAAVLVPAVLLGVTTTDPPDFSEGELTGIWTGGYWIGAVVALAGLALLLWALVAQARTREPGPGGGSPGAGAQIAAVLLLGLSALYLVAIPVAIVVFLLSAALLTPAGLVAVPCVVFALLGLINARGGHCGPSQRTATLAAVAGWTVAVVGMPCFGGIFVLWASGG